MPTTVLLIVVQTVLCEYESETLRSQDDEPCVCVCVCVCSCQLTATASSLPGNSKRQRPPDASRRLLTPRGVRRGGPRGGQARGWGQHRAGR